MAVKPVGPEALYDSLLVVYGASANKNALPSKTGVKPTTDKPTGVKPGSKPEALKADPGNLRKPDTGKPEAVKPMPPKPAAGKPGSGPSIPREEFALFFRGEGGGEPGEFAHGIPQFLRRMNGEQFNAPAPVVDRLVRSGVGTEEAIESLYLTALSRRPSPRERELMAKYIASRPRSAEGYAGELWALLNSGEFVLNR